ncbi:hypothetical protein D3C72_1203600 [compost metagenome]
MDNFVQEDDIEHAVLRGGSDRDRQTRHSLSDEDDASVHNDLPLGPDLEHSIARLVFDRGQRGRIATRARSISRQGRHLPQRLVGPDVVVLFTPLIHGLLAVQQTAKPPGLDQLALERSMQAF